MDAVTSTGEKVKLDIVVQAQIDPSFEGDMLIGLDIFKKYGAVPRTRTRMIEFDNIPEDVAVPYMEWDEPTAYKLQQQVMRTMATEIPDEIVIGKQRYVSMDNEG